MDILWAPLRPRIGNDIQRSQLFHCSLFFLQRDFRKGLRLKHNTMHTFVTTLSNSKQFKLTHSKLFSSWKASCRILLSTHFKQKFPDYILSKSTFKGNAALIRERYTRVLNNGSRTEVLVASLIGPSYCEQSLLQLVLLLNDSTASIEIHTFHIDELQ